jgi:hypothetical protein
MKSQLLQVERLEVRATPTVFGVPWPDASHLTISFAPDGTSVNGQASQLFQLLNTVEPASAWQDAILRAFQTWAASANINIAVVPDGGQPMGTGGAIEGDPRFGDIRISAVPLSPDVVAQAMPFNLTAGTWSGDVQLNSNYLFGNGVGGGQYDLFTVLLHEAGHVFGLPHSDDPASPMYEDFTTVHSSLTAPDMAALQALYGARLPDSYDAKSPNDSASSATKITPANQAILADVTTLSDVDWFQFKTSGISSSLTIRLQTSGLSLLMPRLSIFDANLNPIGSVAAIDHQGNDLVFQLNGVAPGATFYAQVASGTSDVFGIGSYQLFVGTGTSATGNPGGSAFWQGAVNDNNTNNTLATALVLNPKIYQTDARFDYTYKGIISDAGDVDVYRVKAPRSTTGAGTVMTVVVWTEQQPAGWSPAVTVYDVFGNPVAAQVLTNENGTIAIQIANAAANANYYVAVNAATSVPAASYGEYFLGIDFGSQATPLQTFAANTLSAGLADVATLQLSQSTLFHFVLTASAQNSITGGAVQLTITDQFGNNVATVTAAAGSSQSITLLLAPGQYNFAISAVGPASGLSYTLLGLTESDGIGPQAVDTTTSTLPSGSGTSTSSGYIWYNGTYTFLGVL